MMRAGGMRMRVQLLHQQLQVFRSRPATSTHNRDVVLGHEFIKVIRERFGFERIDSLTIHVEWKSRVGDARNGESGIFAEDANGLAHMLGSRRTVETDNINSKTFENDKRGSHISAE